MPPRPNPNTLTRTTRHVEGPALLPILTALLAGILASSTHAQELRAWPYGSSTVAEGFLDGSTPMVAFAQAHALTIAAAGDPTDLERIFSIDTGFVIEAIAVSPDTNRIAVSHETFVTLYDSTDKEELIELDRWQALLPNIPFPDIPRQPAGLAFDLNADRLYVAVNPIGLAVLDHHPITGTMTYRGRYFTDEGSSPDPFPASSLTRVHALDDVVVLQDQSAGLIAVDVGDPTSPAFSSRLNLWTAPGDALYDVDMVGNRAYLSERQTTVLRVVDVDPSADPVTLTEVGSLPESAMPDQSSELIKVTALDAGKVAVLDQNLSTALAVLDASDPTKIRFDDNDSTGGPPIAGVGDLLFAGTKTTLADPTFRVYSTSEARGNDLAQQSSLNLFESAADAWLYRDDMGRLRGLVANGFAGLVELFIEDSRARVTDNTIRIETRNVVSVGDIAVFDDQGVGDLLHFSSLVASSDIDPLILPGRPSDLEVLEDDISFAVSISSPSGAVQGYDITDPNAPQQVFSWTPPPSRGAPAAILQLAVSGTLFAASGFGGQTWIVDTSIDPPQILSEFTAGSFVAGLHLAPDLLLVASGADGLRVWDVSDPTDPQLTDAVNFVAPFDVTDVARFGNTAIAGISTGELALIDLADPSELRVRSYIDSREVDGATFLGLNALGSEVIIAQERTGAVAVDISGSIFSDGFESGDTAAWN